MKDITDEESNTNIFKAISVETFTILGWTVGSALHSIFTKKALSKAISDEPVSARLSYGSYLTIIQLLIAAVTGVTIGYLHRSLSKQKQDSNEEPKNEPLVYNRNTDSSIISDNDFLVLNNGTEKENNNDLNVSELECSKAPSIVLEMTSVYQELNKQSNSSISKHSKLNNPQVEYEYKTEHKYFFSYLWGSNEMILSAVLYAFANICANTALGGGKVMLVQIIKCSELILTAILSYIVLKRKVGLKESVAFGISTIGIFLVVSSTLKTSSTNSIAVTYSVLLASIGAFTISLRNVIVSSANKNEKAIDTFTLLSFWGMITSLIIFVGINIIYGQSKTEIALYPVIISGCFHAMYNFSSLAFLKLVGSPIVHAYFNLAKRAIIVLTAELINCTTPPSMQVFGSSLAILGIHFSKQSKTKDKQIENEEANKKSGKIMLHEEKLYHQKVNTEEVANIEQEEPKSCNKNDKYPYTASVVLSGLSIVIGWLLTYSYSCTGPPMETYSKVVS
ncbi:uncharacterized protein CMU_034680 [Cryptosporidium muris RN66]|uniref:Sugar phosphate transporter domain-containing protein n=1 Tax=Cryptosporidium muris (strain RN66) TaxID=441375 RepID=B6AFU1_CRYMR|nr:uncharacterized protein CMU_034680 [Cryptosporidium muris RN66]EEA07082.1 hypothetical protein, conserved [Cryptosporidium muris RN66]|eukprot:XP_002141431.1 hypothetical protein [Cryptosporidium muris RN66]